VNVEIQIGSTKYRVVFRHIIRCEIRTREARSEVVAEANSICRPPDVFNEREGKVRSFRKCFNALRRSRKLGIYVDLAQPEQRRELWKDFFRRLDPRPKSKKPAKENAPKAAEMVPVTDEAVEVVRRAREAIEGALRAGTL
jgi:hypothetical protein